MEKFDLVNEQDEVIGETDKETSHTDGGIHRCIAIYVFSADGRLYVQEHLNSDRYDHSVGGHVRKGESYDAAAKREGYEELGLSEPLTHIANFYSDETPSGANIRHYFSLYECTPSAAWEFQSNEEVQNIIPMELRDIVDLMNNEPQKFTGGFINTMRKYISFKDLPYTI